MNNIDFSVVVPIYGCKGALYELYNRLTDSLKKLSPNYEIILVNDGCPQNSWEIIENICQNDKHIIGIEMSRNFGQMKAILAGLDYSSGKYVIVMDCDLQDRPEEIPNLYKKLKEGFDIVFARRTCRKDKKSKIILSKIFYKIYSFAIGQSYDAELCNFSISTRQVIDDYCKIREEHRAFVMYLQWMGFKQTSLSVCHDARKEGKSSYNFKKRLTMALNIIFSQSDKFLKIITYFGIFVSMLSFLTILVLVILHFIKDFTIGWISTIATICLMSGINIFVVGVVGLYIGNIFVQVKNRPLYFVRTILNDRKDIQ